MPVGVDPASLAAFTKSRHSAHIWPSYATLSVTSGNDVVAGERIVVTYQRIGRLTYRVYVLMLLLVNSHGPETHKPFGRTQ